MGRDDYEVTGGSVTIDGEELLGLPTWQRAAAGLFLAMQYPVEVPGVPLERPRRRVAARRRDGDADGVHDAVAAEATALGVARRVPARGRQRRVLRRRAEARRDLQLAVLEPKFAILDEIDSGLDVDALRDVAGGSSA